MRRGAQHRLAVTIRVPRRTRLRALRRVATRTLGASPCLPLSSASGRHRRARYRARFARVPRSFMASSICIGPAKFRAACDHLCRAFRSIIVAARRVVFFSPTRSTIGARISSRRTSTTTATTSSTRTTKPCGRTIMQISSRIFGPFIRPACACSISAAATTCFAQPFAPAVSRKP